MKIFLAAALTFLAIASYGQSAKYEKIVADFARNQNSNGTVLVATNGKIDYLKATGIADRQLNVPLTTQLKFKICSITKTFVSVLVLQLYEEGKLKMTDKIGKFLMDYSGEAKEKVDIHQLLTYSSGIPNYEHGKGLEVYQTAISVDNFIDKHCSDSLISIPGTQFNYDNGAYIIFGRIIEKVTGKSFDENLHQRILQPLKMHNTGFFQNGRIVSGLVPSYLYSGSTNLFSNEPPYFIENYYSSAAMYSTVEDLLKFDQAIFTNKLFSPETKELMLTPYPALYSVAYGFWVTESKFGSTVTKTADRQGAIQGSNTTWLHLIPENKTFIIFSNTNATNINNLREKLVIASLNQ